MKAIARALHETVCRF